MAITQEWNSRQYMLSENYEIFYYKDSYLKDVALHHHDFFELYFFISGDVSYIVESRSYDLKTGDILLISPQELHQPIIEQRKQYERIVLWINCAYLRKFSTESSDLARMFDSDVKDRTNLLRLDSETLKPIRAYFLDLLAKSNREEAYSDILSEARLVQLVAELNRCFSDYAGRYEAESSLGGVMNEILDYINRHHTEKLTLDMLSSKFFISKYHMSREFQHHFGITIYKYITKKRLITAKQLMSEGVVPSNVFTECGFTDYANFYRAFKNEYGIAPRDYIEYIEAAGI